MAMVAKAPALLTKLSAQADALDARVPASEQALASLQGQYAPTALRTIGENVDHAKERIIFARNAIQQGQAALATTEKAPAATPSAPLKSSDSANSP